MDKYQHTHWALWPEITVKPVPGALHLTVPDFRTHPTNDTVHIAKAMDKNQLLWLSLKCLEAAMATDRSKT